MSFDWIALFQIKIPNAQLSTNVKKTKLNANSPVLRVKLQQQNSNTVVIFIQPASGVRMGTLNQMGKLVSLKIQRYSNSIISPTAAGIILSGRWNYVATIEMFALCSKMHQTFKECCFLDSRRRRRPTRSIPWRFDACWSTTQTVQMSQRNSSGR